MDRIAVLIVGKQNSGKTTTIKKFEQYFDEDNKNIVQCRVGWRRTVQLYLDVLDAIRFMIFFVPSSPTEKHIPLNQRLNKFKPEMLLVAEQLNGSEYNSTKEFLSNNNYEIKEFHINSTNASDGGTWNRWIDANREDILNNRAIEIGNAFKDFVKRKIQ